TAVASSIGRDCGRDTDGTDATHRLLPRTNPNVEPSGAQAGSLKAFPLASWTWPLPSGLSATSEESPPTRIVPCADHEASPCGSRPTRLPVMSEITPSWMTRVPLGDHPWNLDAPTGP